MDIVLSGMVISLQEEILFESILHGITLISLILVSLGFLFLSYELLLKPPVLQRLIIVLTNVGVSIILVIFLCFFLVPLYLKLLKTSGIPLFILEEIDERYVIADVIVFACLLSILQGILTTLHIPPRQAAKPPHPDKSPSHARRALLRDCSIGLVIALIFFVLDDYVLFINSIGPSWNTTIPDLVQFVVLGAIGGGFWHKFNQNFPVKERNSQPSEEDWQTYHAYKLMDESLLPIFSLKDFIRGLGWWSTIVLLSTVLWLVVRIPYQDSIDRVWYFYLIDLFIAVVPVIILSGFSRYIYWKAHSMTTKRLGIIGAVVSVFGFMLGLIEPVILFSKFFQ